MENRERFESVLRNWEVPEGLSDQEAWNRLEASIKSLPVKSTSSVRRIVWVWSGVAAAVLVAGFFLTRNSEPSWVNAQAALKEHRTVVLPDQSEVVLNAGSTLGYPDEWSKSRLVRLDGQAFFKVVHGSRFTVETDMGRVSVLGTSFDVSARGEDFQVWCHTGKVEVEHLGRKEMLSPGEMAFIEGGQWKKVIFDTQQPFWVNGEFRFENQSMPDVLDELSRQFGINVIYTGGDQRKYTGVFSLESLEDALKSVCLPMQMEFERMEDGSYRVFEAANKR